MLKFFLGVLTTIIVFILWFLILFFLYNTWHLNDTLNKYFWLSYNTWEMFVLEDKNIVFEDNIIDNTSFESLWYKIISKKNNEIYLIENKKIKTIKIDNLSKGIFIYNNISPNFSQDIAKEKSNLILFFYFIENLTIENLTIENLTIEDLKMDIFDYYIDNISKITNDKKIIEQIKNKLTEENLIKYYIYNNYDEKKTDFINFLLQIQNKFNKQYITNDFCFDNFCKIYEKQYMYVKTAIIKSKNIRKDISKYSKMYNIPENVFYAIIIIENIRMHLEYKNAFKGIFFKYKIPQLVIMNSFSYWIYWTKLNVLEKIINSNLYNNDEDIITLKNMKKNIYKIDYIVKNESFQTKLVAMFLDFQKKEYQKIWCNKIDNNIWILATLRNIGGAKEDTIKECNPKTWGAELGFVNMNFGDFANIINDSIDILYIKNR